MLNHVKVNSTICCVGFLSLALISCASNNSNKATDEIILENSVYFDLNSAVIPAKYNKVITLNASYLISHPKAKIEIQGNSSEVGTVSYNKSLGMQRADSLSKALLKAGVKANQMLVVSYGNTKPVFASDSRGLQPKNQRADIVYTSQPPSGYSVYQKIPLINMTMMN